MQNSAFKTLTLIAKKNFKKLFLTFSLVLAENGLFLVYSVLAGIAINAIVAGYTLLALSYSCMVFVGWGLGSIRRRVDTQVFTRIYAGLAVSVIMNEKRAAKDESAVIARANLSREFVDFFEQHFPVFLPRSSRFSARRSCFYLSSSTWVWLFLPCSRFLEFCYPNTSPKTTACI